MALGEAIDGGGDGNKLRGLGQRYFRGIEDTFCTAEMNWFHAISSGAVEGSNNKRKLITRKLYGFRTQKAYETALYHHLGALPMKELTHRLF